VTLLADPSIEPTMGQSQWHLRTTAVKKWLQLELPYIRKNSRIGLSVYSSSNANFYVRVLST
jgi:hypothetical protein